MPNLTYFAGGKGYAWPSLNHLAEELHISRRHVIKRGLTKAPPQNIARVREDRGQPWALPSLVHARFHLPQARRGHEIIAGAGARPLTFDTRRLFGYDGRHRILVERVEPADEHGNFSYPTRRHSPTISPGATVNESCERATRWAVALGEPIDLDRWCHRYSPQWASSYNVPSL